VFEQVEPGLALAEGLDGIYELGYSKLILATGARERFLPFEGWTLPNVFGAGGLQALVKSGMPVEGKKVIVAGSGPLLLAVADYLRGRGADILLIAEQARRSQLLGFVTALVRQPIKAAQAVKLRANLRGVKYLMDCRVVAARADGKISSVTLRMRDRAWDLSCDFLACGFHLVPNVELAALLGCELVGGGVRVDDFQETSVPNIYCAGEPTGIGGLELSLVEGEVAGLAASERHDEARKLFTARAKLRRFADSLNRAFALGDELKTLARPDTIVCRCEDVTFERIKQFDSWRAAKLQTRCGMGPCQGRVCGPAIEFLMGWKAESVRPPIFPVRLESLAHAATRQTEQETIHHQGD
jgi:NADPH-dependent 2,4-dienoyl-CoA reductase/sulfur reductase-like enzyme